MSQSNLGANLPSPMSQFLRGIGMTRKDLQRGTEAMRQFLTVGEAKEGRVFAPTPETSLSSLIKSRPSGRSRAGSSANASALAPSPTPPRTPVKLEPVDGAFPPRLPDTMEMVMELKSRGKRERANSAAQSRDARRVPHPSSATSSRSATPQAAPETPHHYRHYSERVVSEALTLQPLMAAFNPDVALPRTPQQGPHSQPQFRVPGPPSTRSKTPSGRNIYSLPRTPNHPSPPCSSPSQVVNIVSSPGPMRSSPAVEDEEDELPFVLPPGPYSSAKPDFAYAGLIGQAILSSPQHRLTLQDIYEWITTVYPYYKRGEQTWMNSVRHCLSTMAVFRKVPRGRSEGKSLWAIFDEDVNAFTGGGFRKNLCADMVKADKDKASKRGPKKRGTMDEIMTRDTKRRKKNQDGPESAQASGSFPVILPAPVLPPYFPGFHPSVHHQPYYPSYPPPPIPADVIFPPLPPSSNYHRLTAVQPSTAGESTEERLRGEDQSPKPISSASSVPALTPNCSSSSSPPLSSQASIADVEARYSRSPSISSHSGNVAHFENEGKYDNWLQTAPSVDALSPSATLLNHKPKKVNKGKGRQARRELSSQPVPTSPTLERRLQAGKQREAARRELSTPPPDAEQMLPVPCTPPRRPCTPPRRQRITSGGIQLSPTRTPLSHAGLHMSPSASLAHYKANLDPPPIAMYHPSAPLLSVPLDGPRTPPPLAFPENVHTPSRKRPGHSSTSGALPIPSPFAPVTPKRHPRSGGMESPMFTPARYLYDPHDPSAILDEELSRQVHESPGLFGKSRSRAFYGSLLYDSPTAPSPDAWERFW